MKMMAWLLVVAMGGVMAWAAMRGLRRMRERREAEEARMASFLAESVPGAAKASPQAMLAAMGAPPPVSLAEKLLLESAEKASEAGEAALSIQLYARLVARFPQGALAAQARAAVEAQKKKLAISRAPGPAGRG